MAFRAAPGALVIGSTTATADGNISPIPLPGRLRTVFSGIGVFNADKRPTQRVGVVPDIEVKPTPRSCAAFRSRHQGHMIADTGAELVIPRTQHSNSTTSPRPRERP